jgi:hypothetical protein
VNLSITTRITENPWETGKPSMNPSKYWRRPF